MKAGIYSGRRKIRWESVRGPKRVIAFMIATALGAGLFPLAPGTMGTLVALPLAYFTRDCPWEFRFFLWVGLAFLGTWAAQVFDETMQTADNQNIVIDEVVGLGITAWTVGDSPLGWLLAFLLFRFFDVLKLPPVRSLDTWSKKQASLGSAHSIEPRSKVGWASGFGVMVDDIVAGFQGLLVMVLLQRFGLLPF